MKCYRNDWIPAVRANQPNLDAPILEFERNLELHQKPVIFCQLVITDHF